MIRKLIAAHFSYREVKENRLSQPHVVTEWHFKIKCLRLDISMLYIFSFNVKFRRAYLLHRCVCFKWLEFKLFFLRLTYPAPVILYFSCFDCCHSFGIFNFSFYSGDFIPLYLCILIMLWCCSYFVCLYILYVHHLMYLILFKYFFIDFLWYRRRKI